MHDFCEVSEEHKLLLRDLKQAAKTLLDVRAEMPYALQMFRLALQHEALARTDNNRSHAAKMLGMHRNTFTLNLPPEERRSAERFKRRPPARTVRVYNPTSGTAGDQRRTSL